MHESIFTQMAAVATYGTWFVKSHVHGHTAAQTSQPSDLTSAYHADNVASTTIIIKIIIIVYSQPTVLSHTV